MAAAWLFLAGPAWAQVLTSPPEAVVSVWRVIGALGVCLLLAAAAAIALKARLAGRMAGSAPMSPAVLWKLALANRQGAAPKRLGAVETLRVSDQLEVCLFSCDGREFLVAVSPHGLAQLDRDRDVGRPGEHP